MAIIFIFSYSFLEVKMKKLSLCMIVKNEEENIDTVLGNARSYADEIIIVDTGSTDNTKKLASKYTDKIYDYEWRHDFSKARNYAFEKANNDYLMWLDADDFVSEKSAKSIVQWKEDGDECDVVICPYVTNFDKDYNPLFQFNRERIVKNDKRFRFKDRVHEVIVPSGKIVVNNDIIIFHNKKNKPYTTRNLDIYQKMLEEGENLSPRSQFYYARELYFNGKYDEAIRTFSRYLAEGKGWIENNIEACLNLSKCYQAKKEAQKALAVLFGSFVYDLPRGETLYEIGNVYLGKEDYLRAIYYFKLALASKPNLNSGAFVNLECYTFLPALQLCLCYYKLGDNLNALHYHEISKGFKPNDKKVLHNEKYFKSIK